MQIVCFDTETTGLDVQKEHIIQLSLVKFNTDNWQITDQRDWYILPEGKFDIPAEAQAVHHITKEFLMERGVRLRDVFEDFKSFVGDHDMLSYNGNGFDAPLLHYNLKRLGLDFSFDNRVWYDALTLERIHMEGKTDPATGERYHCNLTATYTRYYGHPFEGAHNSLDDVLATIEVFKAQVSEHGWEWAKRDDFGFISFDRWLTKKGGQFLLNQGNRKGQSLEDVLESDRNYLEWLVDKCSWTDAQTKEIVGPLIGRPIRPAKPKEANIQKPVSRGKKRSKGTISEADLCLF